MKNKNIILGIISIIIVIVILTLSKGNKEETAINTYSDSENTSQTENKSVSAGNYETYSPEKLAFAENGNIVLFFHASWCPSCRALDKNIKKNLSKIPENLKILKVDYDNSREMKRKYTITTQHTLVEVDKGGNMINKWVGSPTLEDIVSRIQ